MSRLFRPRGALRPGLLLAALMPAGLSAAAPDTTVHLPTFTVNDRAPAADTRPWRYLSVRGYEFLSRASDRATQDFAAHLLRFSNLIERVYPAVGEMREPLTRVVICGDRSDFEAFVPAKVRVQMPALGIHRLFLDDRGSPLVVLDASAGQQLGSYEVDLERSYFAARLSGAIPRLPAWYVEGISRIFAAAQVTEWSQKFTVVAGRLDGARAADNGDDADTSDDSADPGPNFGPMAEKDPARGLTPDVERVVQNDVLALPFKDAQVGGAASPPPDPDGRRLTFLKFFSDSNRPFPPLEAVLAGDPSLDYVTWSQSCGLFVHYCLFGYDKSNQAALAQFIVGSLQTPGREAQAFQAAFKHPYADLKKKLDYYSRSVNYRTTGFSVPRFPEPDLAVREASPGESADIASRAFACAGYPERAEAQLLAADRGVKAAGSSDLRLDAALGLWDEAHGQAERGQALVAQAAAGRYPDAALYADLARRRLAACGGRPLDPADTGRCLEPVQAGVAAGAGGPELYEAAAAIWVRSAETPGGPDFKLLADGLRAYPADAGLAYDTTLVLLRSGAVPQARAVVRRELASGDPEARDRFAPLGKQAGL